jgi:hypothetical protein
MLGRLDGEALPLAPVAWQAIVLSNFGFDLNIDLRYGRSGSLTMG